jgi:Domain of unknown function (DUF4082)
MVRQKIVVDTLKLLKGKKPRHIMKALKFKSKSTTWLAPALMVCSALSCTTAHADGGAGLWPLNHQAAVTDCGSFNRDSNNFCNLDDGGAVELGVAFTVSKPVLVTGVRIYRVDHGVVTGSLWLSDGTLLAKDQFDDYSGNHGWQDVTFGSPVAVSPNQIYIASYFAPNAQYAFEWNFFTNNGLTVGPVTALQAGSNKNGLFCYFGDSCNLFPSQSFRDSNYWVSPLWAYHFKGFYSPVDNLAWNKSKAGSAIPVKFSLTDDMGLSIFKDGYPKVKPTACPNSGIPSGSTEQTNTAGGSTLVYDATAKQYVYTWKTSKDWAGKCYVFDLGLNDNSVHTFKVQF